MAVCRTLTTTGALTLSDTFDEAYGTALNSRWTDGGWTIGGLASAGLPYPGSGNANVNSATGPTMRCAKLTSQSLSTQGYRDVSISWAGPAGSIVRVMLDMADSSPNPNLGGYMLAAHRLTDGTTSYLILSKNGTEVARKKFLNNAPPAGSGGGLFWILRLSVDGANVVRCYWSNANVPDLTYQPSSYAAAGGQVGFALAVTLSNSASQATWFKLSHNTSSGALPPEMLMMSKNGLLYYESTNGNMIQVNTALTLASDRRLSSVNRLDKLYIADYGLRSKSTSGSATTSGSTLTDTTADFVTDAVDADDDMVEISASTGGNLGTFPISSITDLNTIVVTGTLGTGTGVSYRVLRAPKVFDSSALTLTRMVATAGSIPPGCTIVALCFDRLIWTGDPDNPTAAAFSRVGFPLDYLKYVEGDVNGARYYNPASDTRTSGLGDHITTMIPHEDDYLVIGGKRSTFVLRGDPGLGSVPDTISHELGIISHFATCYTPEQTLVVLTQDGLYGIATAQNNSPQKISRDRIPEELKDIRVSDYDISVEYDGDHEGVRIFVTGHDPSASSHWFFDWRTKSFHRETYPGTMEPTATTTHAYNGYGVPSVILGGRDGLLRISADDRPDDDGTNFESFILIGPIALGATGYHDGILREVIGQLAADSGDVTLQIQVGDSVESAFNAVPRDAFTLRAGKNLTHSPRLRGNACFLRLSSSGGTAWAMEQMSIVRESLGKQRLL